MYYIYVCHAAFEFPGSKAHI